MNASVNESERAIFRRFFDPSYVVQVTTKSAEDYGAEAVYLRFFLAPEHVPATQRDVTPGDQVAAVSPSGAVVAEPAEEAPARQRDQAPKAAPLAETVVIDADRLSLFQRVKKGLQRTRTGFASNIAALLLGKKRIDADLLEEVETQLLVADVGVSATQQILDNLTEQMNRSQLADSDALYAALQQELRQLLDIGETNPYDPNAQLGVEGGAEAFRLPHKPYVILVVGVNGVGKTTTIGKLAKRLQVQGQSVMLAAGDTFRAAAVEQLQVWGERNAIPVVAQQTGADSASVIFDAVQSAKAKQVDVLIADTAGRLHTKSNLMEELKKVRRVMAKVDPTAPHEVMLVVDAGTGQNAINQAEQFHQAVALTGITLTKLDGTAKGGIVFALSERMKVPIRYIGVGEKIDDLKPFAPHDFVEALFDSD